MRDRQFRSRKTRKRALKLNQHGHSDGMDLSPPTGRDFLTPLIDRLRGAFGSSKHRGARKQRFKARQARKR